MRPGVTPVRPGPIQPKAGPILPKGGPIQPARPGAPRVPGGPVLPQAARPVAVQPSGGHAFALPTTFALRPRGSGQPLPEAVQRKMEAFFKADFSDVRVHVGTEATSIGAFAFTRGSDLYFAPGQYNPQSVPGQRLLGHELAHVVQQRAGRVRNPMGAGVAVVQDPALEAEADRMGMQAASAPLPIQAKPAGRALSPSPSLTPKLSPKPAIIPPRVQAQNGAVLPSTAMGGAPAAGKPILPRPAGFGRFNRSSVVQRVRFSNSNSFYGNHFAPAALHNDLAQALAAQYTGRTEMSVFQIGLTPTAKLWLAQNAAHIGLIGDLVWAEVLDTDWETLGSKPLTRIEVEGMSQSFFDQQTSLMNDLGRVFSNDLLTNPGRPMRIASFQLVRVGNGPLITRWANKAIEDTVAPSITPAFLPDQPNFADLRARVQANVNQTLFSAGQFQWIAANWANISATHDVYIDVDYYPDRKPDRSGLLHKDSVGETLFVNLSYNNPTQGISPEYMADNEVYGDYEANFPDAAKNLIATVRSDNADASLVNSKTLPMGGRASFIDPAIWHATPLYNRRNPLPTYDDNAIVSLDQVRQDINNGPYSEEQKAALLLLIVGKTGSATGRELKDYYRQRDLLRFGTRADTSVKDTAPLGRTTRALSVHLDQQADQLEGLKSYGQQVRSFIRTWIILRRR